MSAAIQDVSLEESYATAETSLLGPEAKKRSKSSYTLRFVYTFVVFLFVAALITAMIIAVTPDTPATDTVTTMTVYNMDKYVLENVDAMCNDGSAPAFYYYAGAPDSTEWVIYLEGHESCHDEQSCADRLELFGEDAFGTEDRDKQFDITEFGILSPDPEGNSYFYDRNMVLPMYCSSDSWVGNAKAGEDGNPMNFHFMGSLILDAILAELSTNFGMIDATSIFMAGDGSMGSIGAFLNQDRVQRDLAPALFPNAEIIGITDLAWFVEYDCFDGQNSSVCGPVPIMQASLEAWNAVLPNYCDQFVAEGEGWRCWFPANLDHQEVIVRTFHFQNVYDWGLLWALGVPGPQDESNLDFIEAFAQEQRDVILASGVTAYVADCSWHGVIKYEDWWKYKMDGTTPMDAFAAFYHSGDQQSYVDQYYEFDGNPSCKTAYIEPDY